MATIPCPALLRRLIALLLAALLMAGCSNAKTPPAPPARVALWTISDNSGVRGWLLGTVHALPPETVWRRAEIDTALGAADRLVLEIGEPLDSTVAGEALGRLAFTAGLPPPSARITPDEARALGKVYKELSLSDDGFKNQESWAVALQLAAIAAEKQGIDPESGVEPKLREMAGAKPITGLETIDSQFAIFDALPDRAQQVLLGEVAREAADSRDDERDVMELWLRGDDLGIARESMTGFLADPQLREALLTRRNSAWTAKIDALLKAGARPFIAVGAAHLAGSEAVQRMLAARGWRIARVP
ncbi:TraB/GumN family protein [Novosphingobium sp. Chol11]|uniref:TraB/GumN family protein n=1 Tax=Novosphingobium sp. Chol11 TaxID=1385763 RepID=UPI0025EA752F|nr:TraB/GumN family protein [Novosphingobium sp. Chol11]